MNRVGTVYGEGLYALAQEEGLEESILQELSALETAFAEQEDFVKLLACHQMSKQERTGILDESFRGKVHPYVLNFLKLLTEKGYIRHFAACCRAYREQYNLDKGILEVQAVSASALTESQQQRLTEKLASLTGKKIDLVCRKDPQVLGGLRLHYDGVEVDGTVQGRLAAIEKQLKNTVL